MSLDVSDSEALGVVAFQRRGTDIEPGVIVEACSLEGMTLRKCEQAHTFAFTKTEYTTPIEDVTINGRDAIRYIWMAELAESSVNQMILICFLVVLK